MKGIVPCNIFDFKGPTFWKFLNCSASTVQRYTYRKPKTQKLNVKIHLEEEKCSVLLEGHSRMNMAQFDSWLRVATLTEGTNEQLFSRTVFADCSSGSNPVATEIHYLLLFRVFHIGIAKLKLSVGLKGKSWKGRFELLCKHTTR